MSVSDRLRASEDRLAFLLRLSDAIRPLADPGDIQAVAMRCLGEKLDVDRALYFRAEQDEEGWVHVIDSDYFRLPEMPSLVGRYPQAAFGGPALLGGLERGEPVAIADVLAVEFLTPGDLDSFRRIGVRAFAAVPVSKNGVYVAGIGILSAEVRNWSAHQITLIQDTADRTWSAIQHAHADASRRETEARYHTLFASIDEGFCIIEMLFDADQKPVDYRFIEVNPAFERQTGLHAVEGMRIRAMVPEHEQHWFEVYGRIALTGEPMRFENRAQGLNRWYEVYAFRVGAPEQRRVAVLFNDITERKRAETALQESEANLRRNELWLAVQKQAFQVAMDGGSLEESLGTLTQAVSEHVPGARCAFYIVDETGGRLAHVVGMPPSYAAAIEGFEVSPESLACGLAIAIGKPVITPDVHQEPRWKPWTWLGDQYGYRGCWSFPVETSAGRLVGSFATYFKEPRDAGPREMDLAAMITKTAAIIISHHRENEKRIQSERQLRDFGEASQDVLWTRDAETLQWRYLTPAFETIYGISRDEALSGDNFRSWLDLIVPEDRLRAEQAIKRVRQGEYVTFDYRIRRPIDGAIRWMRNTDFPIVNAAGDVTIVGGIGHDDTAFHETERRLQTLMEGIPQLVWRSMDGGRWTWSSPQWTEYTGLSLEESAGLGWLTALHPDDRPSAMRLWTQSLRSGHLDLEYRLRHAATGEYRWFQTRATPVRDNGDSVIEWLGTSTDIHDIRELQERQKVLVAELQHRTRNLMAVIRAVADKTARSSGDLVDFRDRFRDRLDALTRVQGLLSRIGDLDRVTFDELIRTELSAMTGDIGRVTLKGPVGIRLRSSTVQTLALALHELATNAMKYGALGQAKGRLAITWSYEQSGAQGKPWLHIDWRESGVDMPAGAVPTGTGQGRELIEQALPYQLQAKTSYNVGPEGIHCSISIPVSETTDMKEVAHV